MANDNKITNEEIVEYLKLLYRLLEEAKSNIDIERLSVVTKELSKQKNKVINISKRNSELKNNQLMDIIKKKTNCCEITIDEKQIMEEFIQQNSWFDIAISKKYLELNEFLHNCEQTLTVNQLLIIHFCITEQETKLKKRSDILREVYDWINQNIYFDNMDKKYESKSTSK